MSKEDQTIVPNYGGGSRMIDREMQKALEADGEKLRQLTGQDHGPVFLGDAPAPEYIRGVLTNNIERAIDVVWDLQNKPEFNKNDPSTLGVIAVAEQIVVSLTALVVDLDNAPVTSHHRAQEE